jgi:hypothetical protein
MDFPHDWVVFKGDLQRLEGERAVLGERQFFSQRKHRLIAMRELDVFDAEGAGIPAGEFLRLVNDLDEDGPCAASYRFAVVVGEDNKPRLQIQSLPASAVFLSGKALLKG